MEVRFCGNCGNLLDTNTGQCPRCGWKIPSNQIILDNPNNNIPSTPVNPQLENIQSNQPYTSYTYAQQQFPTYNNQLINTKGKKRKKGLIIGLTIGFAILILSIIILFLVFKDNNDNGMTSSGENIVKDATLGDISGDWVGTMKCTNIENLDKVPAEMMPSNAIEVFKEYQKESHPFSMSIEEDGEWKIELTMPMNEISDIRSSDFDKEISDIRIRLIEGKFNVSQKALEDGNEMELSFNGTVTEKNNNMRIDGKIKMSMQLSGDIIVSLEFEYTSTKNENMMSSSKPQKTEISEKPFVSEKPVDTVNPAYSEGPKISETPIHSKEPETSEIPIISPPPETPNTSDIPITTSTPEIPKDPITILDNVSGEYHGVWLDKDTNSLEEVNIVITNEGRTMGVYIENLTNNEVLLEYLAQPNSYDPQLGYFSIQEESAIGVYSIDIFFYLDGNRILLYGEFTHGDMQATFSNDVQ